MKRKILRIFFIMMLMLPLAAVAHYFLFPEETRCMLVRFAGFNKQQNIYAQKNTSAQKIHELIVIRSAAEKKVKNFWSDKSIIDYTFIYCNNENDFNKYAHAGVPAATQLKMGAYVVVQDKSLDINIIAHEIAHTVLYNNIGWYKTKFVIPAWFDEGLAMQVDERDYYSIDTLMAKKNAGVQLPDITRMTKPADFFSGDVMLNFLTAKYIVHEWLKTHSLHKFLQQVNDGDDFEKAAVNS